MPTGECNQHGTISASTPSERLPVESFRLWHSIQVTHGTLNATFVRREMRERRVFASVIM